MTELSPIVKLNQKGMIKIAKCIPTNFLTVRLLDLISPKTLKSNKVFYKIKASGGIHKYLNYSGEIILSLIVKDEMLPKLTAHDYSYIIKTLKPNFYTTPDCETYHNEETISISEIKKSIIQTQKLIELCPFSVPLGHVKGCNEWLVIEHVNMLKLLGIKDFLFHVGDFLRNGEPSFITTARNLAYSIKQNARSLFLYGMGSQLNLINFSFADVYITHAYFFAATHGKRFEGTKKVNKNKDSFIETTRKNLIEMYNNLENSKKQRKLFSGGGGIWEEDQEEVDLHTEQPISL